MKVLTQWLMLQGRLSRGQFWLRMVFLWVLFYGVWEVLALPVQEISVWVVNVPMLWFLVTLCVRRLHDRNYAGWWVLVIVVPVAGAFWLLWQLVLRSGLSQENRWGPDPMQAAGDFLVVR